MVNETVQHLREVLNQRIDFLEKLMNERQELNKEALELNSKEISRRLEILNGEAGHLKQIQATYVPREIYDSSINTINSAIHAIQTTMASQQGKSQALAAFISAGISLLVAFLSISGLKFFH
jgi:hypothetical protein